MALSTRTAHRILAEMLKKVEPDVLRELLEDLSNVPGNKGYRVSMEVLKRTLEERMASVVGVRVEETTVMVAAAVDKREEGHSV